MPQSDYARIEKAIQFIDVNFRDRPRLDQVAAHLHLSRYHFQRGWLMAGPIIDQHIG